MTVSSWVHAKTIGTHVEINHKAFHPTWIVASAKYLSICKISSNICVKRNPTLYSPVLFNLTCGGQLMNIASTLPRTVFYFVAVRDKTLTVYEIAGLPMRARAWHPNTKYVPISANSLQPSYPCVQHFPVSLTSAFQSRFAFLMVVPTWNCFPYHFVIVFFIIFFPTATLQVDGHARLRFPWDQCYLSSLDDDVRSLI